MKPIQSVANATPPIACLRQASLYQASMALVNSVAARDTASKTPIFLKAITHWRWFLAALGERTLPSRRAPLFRAALLLFLYCAGSCFVPCTAIADVTISGASLVTYQSATVNGMFYPTGYTTTCYLEYGLTTAYGYTINVGFNGQQLSPQAIASTITGLTSATTYHCRFGADDWQGSRKSGDLTFATANPPPVVTTGSATGTGYNATTVNGIVNPKGLATTYYFQYGQTASYGITTGTQSAGSGTVAVPLSAAITGLNPTTTYHYQLVAANSSGTTPGEDRTFTTPNPPVIQTQPVQSQIVNSGNAVTLSVTATGTGTIAYQWLHNGLPAEGATTSSLTLTNVQYADRGYYQVKVTDSTGTVLSAASFLNVLLQPDGLFTWGNNSTAPTGLNNVIAIAAGGSHSLALQADGTVAAWGDNVSGQTTIPPGMNNVVAIVAGDSHSLALKSDGTVVAWGANSSGQATIPTGLRDVVAIAAGFSHSLALKSDGTIVAWGYNSDGQTTIPPGLNNVIAIAAGGGHSVALKSDGTVTAWGANNYGQTTIPTGLNNVVAIAAGGYPKGYDHNLALESNGTVVAWGCNGDGQTTVPSGLSNVKSIAACDGGSLALKGDGTIAGWGNQAGVPSGLSGVVAIAAGLAIEQCTSTIVAAGPVTGTTYRSTTLNGMVDPNAAPTTVYFQYGTTTAYGNTSETQDVGNGNTGMLCSSSITGLSPSTTYHYRIVATNSAGTTFSSDRTFSTAMQIPAAITGTTSNITFTTCTLNGSVNPNGLATIVYFQYGLTAAYGNATLTQDAGNGNSDLLFTSSISGLIPSTLYHYRIVARNAAGTIYVYSLDKIFSTNPPPTITSGSATRTVYNGSTLNETVNPNGLATTYYFHYGLTAAYGLTTGTQGAGSGTSSVPLSTGITGLSPATTYHYQLVATNSTGTTYGPDQTFTTTKALDSTTTSAQITKSETNIQVSVKSVAGYSYQLQRADSLSSPTAWQSIGNAQPGTDAVLTFADSVSALANSAFYRVQISQ